MLIPDHPLYDGAVYSVDISSLNKDLQKDIGSATFLGRGASSAAWLLPNNTVLKLTTDEAAWSLSKWQQEHASPHLPKVLDAGQLGVTLKAFEHNTLWEKWYFFVQPFYTPIDPMLWESIENAAAHIGASKCKTRPGWCKTKNGLMAHGQLAQEHLVKLQKAFEQYDTPSLMQAACAVSMLAQWWSHTRTKAGLDVDKQDNWAMDNGALILLDPVYGNDQSQSGYHWIASV